MTRDPDEQANLERRRELLREEEAFRLQQEQGRLEAARKSTTFAWIINGISFLVGLLEILLVLRFVLRVAGANTQNTFARVIYDISDPFIAPFSTLFISPTTRDAGSIFDLNVLVAIVVYALLGWIAISLVRFLQGR
ncbi:MAG: YggT family protein [Stenomitos rutilans HA7619-LM2]|nr:YggT family protein [Stenomitos rutilans HA7619-LM2]